MEMCALETTTDSIVSHSISVRVRTDLYIVIITWELRTFGAHRRACEAFSMTETVALDVIVMEAWRNETLRGPGSLCK